MKGIDVLPTIESPGPGGPGPHDGNGNGAPGGPGGPGGSGPVGGPGAAGGAPARRRRVSPRLLVAAGAVVVLLVVALVVLRGGDDGAEAAACPPSDIPEHGDDTLVVSGDPWSGYAPFRDPELLAGTDYSLQWVEQICQDVRADDMDAGRTDIVVTTLDQYLLQAPAGTVVGVIDQSRGADALVLGTVDNPDLDSVDDVPALVDRFAEDGRKPVLAYTGSSPSEMLLNELSNTTEVLRLTDFELVSVDQSATAYEMLRNDEAQLAVLWEPDTSSARAEGYTVSLSSADVPDSVIDVIVASDDLIARDPGAVQALVGAFYGRMDTYLADADLETLTAFYAEDGGLDTAAAQTIVDGVLLYGTAEADAFMNSDVFPLDKPQVEESVEAIGSLLALIHPDITLENAKVDGRYVSDLVR